MLTQAVHPSTPYQPGGGMGQVQWATGVGMGLLEVEIRCVEQDLIRYVGQLELANVPTAGWIIDTDIHGFLYGSCDVVHLSNHNGEVVHTGVMNCGFGRVIDGGRDPEVFLEPYPKGLGRFPFVLLITLQPVKPLPVNYSNFLCDVIPILRDHQEVFNCVVSLKVDLASHFTTNVPETLTKTFCIGYHHIDVIVVVVTVVFGVQGGHTTCVNVSEHW